ncbi:uncharacterized protein [Clytia hemisphaerica]|uniref:Uncharacterized protein n=1 Tax=Clytia hemisphaerica TaxID=252671 RepID=A0A7M5X786_9CNID
MARLSNKNSFNAILLIVLASGLLMFYTHYGTFTVSEEDPDDIEDIEVYHPPLSENRSLADTNKDQQAIYSQLKPVQWYKDNWKGDCPYPSYVFRKLESQSWFSLYLHHQMKVDLSRTIPKRLKKSCTRWWHAHAEADFGDLPHRKFTWKEQKPNHVRPNCSFGQKRRPWTRCSKKHQELWTVLDKLGVIYFIRSGSELGVIRGSSYLSMADEWDVDVFVDVPQEKLIRLLENKLNPRPHIDGSLESVIAETHWHVKGCPEIHMVFNEWMVDQMVQEKPRPTHDSLCTCYMNSAKLACHKDAIERMYAQYGPSWFVPLHAKFLDFPWAARGKNIQPKLKKLTSPDGIIYEKAVRDLDGSIQYTKYDMEMILAQLNVLQSSILSKYSSG